MKQELSPTIEDYQRFRRSQDFSKGTLNVDKQVLKRFLAINGNIWCHSLKEKHINSHFEEASRTRSAATLRNDHTVLTQFLEWLRQTGRMPMDSNPMYGRRQPRPMRRERNRVPVSDFSRLLCHAQDRDPRDRALVGLLLYTLMRDSEISSLRIRDVDLQGGWITAHIHKTRQEDLMPIPAELDTELRAWLTHYQQKAGPLNPNWFLVPARATSPVWGEGGKFTHHNSIYKPERQIRAVGVIVRPVLEAIGFPVTDVDGKGLGEGAHTIRRSGARALFDTLIENRDERALRVVQAMLHHASSEMTERYLGITADRRARDDIIRGKTMYSLDKTNVLELAR
jgi:integrase